MPKRYTCLATWLPIEDAVIGIKYPVNTHENTAVCIFTLGTIKRKLALFAKFAVGELVICRAADVVKHILILAVELVRKEVELSIWLQELPQNAED